MDQKHASCEIKGCGSTDGVHQVGAHKICHTCLHKAAPFIVAYFGALETMQVGDLDAVRESIKELESHQYLSIYDTVNLDRMRKELKNMEVVV